MCFMGKNSIKVAKEMPARFVVKFSPLQLVCCTVLFNTS